MQTIENNNDSNSVIFLNKVILKFLFPVWAWYKYIEKKTEMQ